MYVSPIVSPIVLHMHNANSIRHCVDHLHHGIAICYQHAHLKSLALHVPPIGCYIHSFVFVDLSPSCSIPFYNTKFPHANSSTCEIHMSHRANIVRKLCMWNPHANVKSACEIHSSQAECVHVKSACELFNMRNPHVASCQQSAKSPTCISIFQKATKKTSKANSWPCGLLAKKTGFVVF